MAIQSQPSRISEPFAGSGTKNTIPATNATPSASQAASWASGFPPECSQPISAGGCPVPRNDMNGVLNWLSQGFAFKQDGGVWEWSALADYDTQRIVRGSDGLLYWSVQQSGPGFASGAVDPATDDGTYWKSPYVKTMDPFDSSNAAASTAWVQSWYEAQMATSDYYVDPASGDDANAGTDPSSPLRTVGGFYARLNVTPFVTAAVTAHLAAGTYGTFLSNQQVRTQVNFLGPSSGVAAFTGGYFAQGSSTILKGRLQFSKSINISRSASVSFFDGLYLNFHNLGKTPQCLFVYQNGIASVPQDSSITISYTGTNDFTNGNFKTETGGRIVLTSSSSMTGTVSGKRYYCVQGSGISGTGSVTFIPGKAAGTTDSTSYYN